MNRIWLAVAAAAGVVATADVSRADFGGPPVGPPPAMYGSGGCGPECEGRYGLLPLFRKAIWWKKDSGGCGTSKHGPRMGGCGPGGCGWGGGHGGYGTGYPMTPGVGYPGTPGAQMPGTLVFPNHPFNRGPRDYFMWEPGR